MNGPGPRRNTRQRAVVLEELRGVNTHPTAVELYQIVRRRLPKISLGTVYRNLELLSRAGTIRKLDLGSGEARFDGDTRRHEHVRCVRCGRVGDVDASPEEMAGRGALERLSTQAGGYQILGYRLEFLGVCPRCAAAETTRPGCPPMDNQGKVE
ncbi:MAG: transcriptional repressor [Pirellulales bacterium]|nr:transcriptional repressor [Pirellulales bacterium]